MNTLTREYRYIEVAEHGWCFIEGLAFNLAVEELVFIVVFEELDFSVVFKAVEEVDFIVGRFTNLEGTV
jgi:hypothetical protein